MGSEYRKKRVKTQPVISEQDNDSLRVLARIIARAYLAKKGHARNTNAEQNSITKRCDGAKQ